jgi:hypothetical protein
MRLNERRVKLKLEVLPLHFLQLYSFVFLLLNSDGAALNDVVALAGTDTLLDDNVAVVDAPLACCLRCTLLICGIRGT